MDDPGLNTLGEKGEIVVYQPNGFLKLEVKVFDDTAWLNRHQLAKLFDRDVKTIGKHINNSLEEELSGISTVAKFAIVQNEGGRKIIRQIEHYNLDMIISVGYRVKSSNGIIFRRWANEILKTYIIKGYAINQRFESLEQRIGTAEEKIDFFVKTSLPPVAGIFYNGQVFDAHVFATNLIKSAKKKLILIDNYIDETVLTMLSQRKSGVSAIVYTNNISQSLQLALQKHVVQYPKINVKIFKKFHDRFLIVDNQVYHIGASFKDLGMKIFAFSKIGINGSDLLDIVDKIVKA